MKKKILFGLALSCFMLGTTFKGNAQSDVFDNGFSLKFTYILPGGSFGDLTDYYSKAASGGELYGNQTILDPGETTGYAARETGGFGAGLRLGTMFFLNGIDFHDQMRIGIDVTWMGFNYAVSKHRVQKPVGGQTSHSFGMHNIYFNPEVGPSFSYSPVDNMSLDVAFKVSPTFGFKVGGYNFSEGNVDYEDNIFGVGFGLRYGPAFYFRYQPLLVGFQYNIGNVNYVLASTNRSSAYTNKSNMSSLNIVLGFKF